jgi:methionyl aminopeptidase
MDSPLQQILDALAVSVHVGQTTMELETLASFLLKTSGVEPAFLGYKPEGAPGPYPNVLCVSINNEVIHGIPSERVIEYGDVVSLDLGLVKDGEFDDGATTVIAGQGSAVARRLLLATKTALDAGCAAAKAGRTTHDIGRAIKAVADHFGFGIIKGYGGHGIGSALHLPPHIPNEPLGEPLKLTAGTRIAIEPMFSSKRGDVHTEPNGWTVKLDGGGVAAHFERTIAL